MKSDVKRSENKELFLSKSASKEVKNEIQFNRSYDINSKKEFSIKRAEFIERAKAIKMKNNQLETNKNDSTPVKRYYINPLINQSLNPILLSKNKI